MYCQKCGNFIPDNARFCGKCGAPVNMNHVGKNTSNGLGIGFSDAINSPEFIRVAKKVNRQGNTAIMVILAVALAGPPIASFFMDDIDLGLGIITGIVLFIMMLIISSVTKIRKNQKYWDGVVTERYEEDVLDRNSSTSGRRVYDKHYTIIVSNNRGKRVKRTEIIEARGVNVTGTDIFDTFQLGEKVRYHPRFDYYEKYDKTHLKCIQCPICHKYTSVDKDVCIGCGAPLLK